MNQLINLAAEGPCPMEAWGFPVRDNVLMGAFHSIAEKTGIEVPPSSDTQEYFMKMLSAERAVDGLDWNLSDSLTHYLEKVKSDCSETQVLKKPADEKSARAWFIVYMNDGGTFSKTDIALIASILFDDEAIDDRLVRRLTSGR